MSQVLYKTFSVSVSGPFFVPSLKFSIHYKCYKYFEKKVHPPLHQFSNISFLCRLFDLERNYLRGVMKKAGKYVSSKNISIVLLVRTGLNSSYFRFSCRAGWLLNFYACTKKPSPHRSPNFDYVFSILPMCCIEYFIRSLTLGNVQVFLIVYFSGNCTGIVKGKRPLMIFILLP